MKIWNIFLVTSIFVILAGCATEPEDTSDISVKVGMSRNLLKQIYGEPLRVETNAAGGEDWYYRFYGWSKSQPVTTTTVENTGAESNFSSSTTVEIQKSTGEQPIHLSSEGRVIEPLPSGKVVAN